MATLIGYRAALLAAAASWIAYLLYGVNDDPGMAAVAGTLAIGISFFVLPVLFVWLNHDNSTVTTSYKK